LVIYILYSDWGFS